MLDGISFGIQNATPFLHILLHFGRHDPLPRFPLSGITLVELMVTVAAVAILASIAVPTYRDYIIRGRLTSAHAQLSSLALALQQYYQDHRSYVGACLAGTTAPLPPARDGFTYSCAPLTATGFTITATGDAGSPVAGFVFTLDQSDARTSSGPPGWTSWSSCWIRSRAGDCA